MKNKKQNYNEADQNLTYDNMVDSELVEKAEKELDELLEKYNITDFGQEADANRFFGRADQLRNFLIEASNKNLI